MKKSVFYPLLFLVSFGIITVPLPSSGASYLEALLQETPILPSDEIRALWVVRDALNSKEEVDQAVDLAIRLRFHLLFVQVRGRGDAYYRSALEPEGLSLARSIDEFDPLAYVLQRAHEAGIFVHAWLNVFYVWSDPRLSPPPGHLIRRHPEWLMTDDRGRRMDAVSVDRWKALGAEGNYVSPGNPAVRRHTAEVVRDLVSRYAVDGIHLDYIRYPGANFDFGGAERTAFALRYGVDPLELVRPIDHGASALPPPEIQFLDSLRFEWRTAQVDSMVRLVREAIGALPLSAAVIPEPGEAKFVKGQDWVRWVREGYVDFVVPMAYQYDPPGLIRQIKIIKRIVGRDKFLVGLPLFDNRAQYLGYSVSLLREEGIIGYSLFSYNVLAQQRFALKFLDEVFFGHYE